MSDDPISESAKAAQQIAKATGKAIDAVRDLGGWLDRMFGEAIEQEVGRIWTVPATERRIAAAIYIVGNVLNCCCIRLNKIYFVRVSPDFAYRLPR
jgi:hypothetical protein